MECYCYTNDQRQTGMDFPSISAGSCCDRHRASDGTHINIQQWDLRGIYYHSNVVEFYFGTDIGRCEFPHLHV